MRGSLLAFAIAGCGIDGEPAWLLDDCTLITTFAVDGDRADWVGCRAYWSGTPDRILTVEALTPGTSGSVVAPGTGWVRASLAAASANGTQRTLEARPYGPDLPRALAPGTFALDLWVTGCGNLGAAATEVEIAATLHAGSARVAMTFAGSCPHAGGTATFAGTIAISAAGPPSELGPDDHVEL